MSLTSRLTALLNYANKKTEKNAPNLGEAVRTLVEGYGNGGEEMWRLIKSVDLTKEEAVINLFINKDSNDKPFSLSKCVIIQKGIKPIDETKKTSMKAYICRNATSDGYNKGKDGYAPSQYFGYNLQDNYGSNSPFGYIHYGDKAVQRLDSGMWVMNSIDNSTTSLTISCYQQLTAWYGHIEIWGIDK